GDGWLESVHPDDRDAVLNVSQQAFRNRREHRLEFLVGRADGEYRWMLNVAIPRYGSDVAFHGFVGGCIDITSRREAEQMLRDMNQPRSGAPENRPTARA